jgi:hypothetical protein
VRAEVRRSRLRRTDEVAKLGGLLESLLDASAGGDTAAIPSGLRVIVARATRRLLGDPGRTVGADEFPPFAHVQEFEETLQRFTAGADVALVRAVHERWRNRLPGVASADLRIVARAPRPRVGRRWWTAGVACAAGLTVMLSTTWRTPLNVPAIRTSHAGVGPEAVGTSGVGTSRVRSTTPDAAAQLQAEIAQLAQDLDRLRVIRSSAPRESRDSLGIRVAVLERRLELLRARHARLEVEP